MYTLKNGIRIIIWSWFASAQKLLNDVPAATVLPTAPTIEVATKTELVVETASVCVCVSALSDVLLILPVTSPKVPFTVLLRASFMGSTTLAISSQTDLSSDNLRPGKHALHVSNESKLQLSQLSTLQEYSTMLIVLVRISVKVEA